MEKKLPVVAFSKGAECEADVGLKTEPIKNDRRFVSKKVSKKNYYLLQEGEVLQFIVTTIIFFF